MAVHRVAVSLEPIRETILSTSIETLAEKIPIKNLHYACVVHPELFGIVIV
jgi:hypothetical protein